MTPKPRIVEIIVTRNNRTQYRYKGHVTTVHAQHDTLIVLTDDGMSIEITLTNADAKGPGG